MRCGDLETEKLQKFQKSRLKMEIEILLACVILFTRSHNRSLLINF